MAMRAASVCSGLENAWRERLVIAARGGNCVAQCNYHLFRAGDPVAFDVLPLSTWRKKPAGVNRRGPSEILAVKIWASAIGKG
jgi:hypothetical protein